MAVRGLVEDAVTAATLGREGDVLVDVRPRLAIDGDPERLLQVLTNLLGNALRHSPAGAPVRVTADAADGVVEIAVTIHRDGCRVLVALRQWPPSMSPVHVASARIP